MAIKELNEKQLRAIELLINGESIIKVAEMVGVNRKTVTAWKNDELFRAEMDKQVKALKSRVDSKLAMNIDPIVDKLLKIALNSESDKTSLDACIYAINKLTGTPTNKIADVTEEVKEESKIDLDEELNSFKVVELEEIKDNKKKKAE